MNEQDKEMQALKDAKPSWMKEGGIAKDLKPVVDLRGSGVNGSRNGDAVVGTLPQPIRITF